MNAYEIIGPVMVGPSSSHTAGAARIGYVCRKLMGEEIRNAAILFYGSFLSTGHGHGTDRAVVAGLLGMKPDDTRIPDSLELAEKAGLTVKFGRANLKNAHPNSVVVRMMGKSGRTLEVQAESVGGGRIFIRKIDGIDTNFSGDYPTLIVHNDDKPGHVAKVTSFLSSEEINIATMQLFRDSRGGRAVMVIECDQEVPQMVLDCLRAMKGLFKVTYYSTL